MPHSVRVHAVGGPEALVYEEIAVPVPGPGEVLLRQHAIGVNYIDIYHRTGLYKLPNYPVTIGSEGAGEIIGVGPDVERLKVGDRVAYAGPLGAYAEVRVIAEDRLVKLPDRIDFETAASIMMRGMTARYLLCETYRVDANTTLLFHAAAGGVGLIACQWASALGATTIGTVGSAEKV
jgi:NADPH:quinone reductase